MSDKSTSTIFNSSLAAEPVGPYPHSRRVGQLLFLSGVGPRKVGKKEIPGVGLRPDGTSYTEDFAAQCLATFENVQLILTAAGAKWEQLVDVTVFLTDMAADFATFNQLWGEAFPDPLTQPCRTTIQVGALPTPIAVELKCIAAFPEAAG